MHWLLYVGIALVIVIFILLGVLAHAGYFYTLLIRTVIPLSVPKRVAYKVYRGPYHNNSGFKELQKVAPTATTFGIYYDDPKEVPETDLRFITGCCLPSDSSNSSLERSLQSMGYTIWTFPECTKAVVTEFPYRSALSCLIAPKCVYPSLRKYYNEFDISNTGPVIELYEPDCIRYITPLHNSEGFFVPEMGKHQHTETKKTL